jgi:hypothetical protein
MPHAPRFVPIAALALIGVCVPSTVSAQGFVSPFIGATLTSPSPAGGRSQPGFGVAFGSIGLILGGEFELAYFPEVIDNEPNGLDRSHAWTFSANSFIGPRIGPVKVYGTFGVGDTILSATPLAAAGSLSSHHFTTNAGGGLMVFFGRLGFKGDIRHFRAYGFSVTDIQSSVAFDHFKFWRGTVGLAVRF